MRSDKLITRKCANEFWLKTDVSIQTAADRGATKSVYDGIRKAVGPTKNLTLGEILYNRDEHLGRWVQYFSLLYSKQNTVTNLKHMENLTKMDDLDIEPTVEELSKAITEMASWKAPCSDGIPADLFRQCKFCLLPHLLDILVECWKKGKVPQDMRDTKITLCIRTKVPDRIAITTREFLLGIAGKSFACVVVPHLQKLAERVYPESQYGFGSQSSFSVCDNCKKNGKNRMCPCISLSLTLIKLSI